MGKAGLVELPPDILRMIVELVWEERGPQPAPLEILTWTNYSLVCRSWRAAFLAKPLNLQFEKPLTPAQKEWLLTTRTPLRRVAVALGPSAYPWQREHVWLPAPSEPPVTPTLCRLC